MLARARSLLPHGPLDVARQLVLFCGAYWLYRLVRGLVDGRAAEAFENARAVVDVERAPRAVLRARAARVGDRPPARDRRLELDVPQLPLRHHDHTLAWIYLRRNERFYFVRNMFMVAMGLALVGYVAVPTAPPRFLPELGFSDSVAAFTGVQPDSGSADVLFNPYAAIPSMHVAFALMLGLTMARMVRRRWARALWWAYAPVVSFVVVVTANHWWLDGFLGAVVAAVAAVCAHGVFARARPEVWAWNAAPRHPDRALAAIVSSLMTTPPVERPPRPTRAEYQALMRNRLIESRLTPNAISLTGLALCVVAAVLVWEEYFLLGGIAFIVGSVCDTLDGRYSRMSGKGSPFGAFLDSTLDRIEEGIVLTAVAAHFSRAGRRSGGRRRRRGRARLAHGLLHSGPGRGARRRVQGRHRGPHRAGCHPLCRPRLGRPRPACAGRLRAGRAVDDHGLPAHLARARRADSGAPSSCNAPAAQGFV